MSDTYKVISGRLGMVHTSEFATYLGAHECYQSRVSNPDISWTLCITPHGVAMHHGIVETHISVWINYTADLWTLAADTRWSIHYRDLQYIVHYNGKPIPRSRLQHSASFYDAALAAESLVN